MEIKKILELSALILGIVNGLILLRNYLRDKPKLTVYPIHPEVYQWWFKLPDGEYNGVPTRKYGFLSYIQVSNRGLRKVSIDSWKLYLRTVGNKQFELKPISIPEPKIDLGKSGNIKVLPVMGQRGLLFNDVTMIESGASISGMIYYFAEFYGDEVWNPIIKKGEITGKLEIKDVFNKKVYCKIVFSEKPLEEVKSMIEGIEKIA
ncbi:MAG: hypothetical protein WBA71_04600 [Candidatus Humimicrobiia bacterium]